GIPERGAVEFAVPDGHHFADGVHDGFTTLAREPREFWGGSREFFGQGNLASRDQRLGVIVETVRTAPVARAGEAKIVQSPADGEAQGVVQFGALLVGGGQLLEAADQKIECWLAAAGGVEPAIRGDV